jgi:hypothetical protein
MLGLFLVFCFASPLLASPFEAAQSSPIKLENNHFFDANTQNKAIPYEFTLEKVASFEIQLIRTSILNKTKPTPTLYYINIIRTDTNETIPFNHTFGFLHVPAPFNKSEMTNDEIFNFTSRGGLKYLIQVSHSHEQYTYSIRACYGGCSNTLIAPCLLDTEKGNNRTSCQGNGACIRGEEHQECACDHINWQIQLAELPSSLRWIAEFLGKADSLFNKIMWSDHCVASPDATKVIENLKLSLVIFITVVLAVLILIIGLIIGICCCCCRGSCCKKTDDSGNYTPLSQVDDYDLDAAVDKYREEKQ